MKCNSQFAQKLSRNFVILHKKNFFKKSLDKKLSMWYNGNSGRGNRTRPAILLYFFSLVNSFYKKNKKKWSRFSKSAPTGKEVRIIPYDWNRWESNPRSSHCIGLTSLRCGFTYSIPFLFFIITFLFYFVKGFFKPLHKIIR